MVKLVDLNEEDFASGGDNYGTNQNALWLESDDRPNPNYALPFAAALSCYP
jgi:hypothetical protein